jgi:hypothetical protein
MRLLPLLDRRSAACTGAMAGIYLRLLQQIAAAPAAALRQRQSLPGKAKAMVAARALAGSAVPVPAVGPLGPVTPEPGKPEKRSSADAAAEGPVTGGPVVDDTVAGGRP